MTAPACRALSLAWRLAAVWAHAFGIVRRRSEPRRAIEAFGDTTLRPWLFSADLGLQRRLLHVEWLEVRLFAGRAAMDRVEGPRVQAGYWIRQVLPGQIP